MQRAAGALECNTHYRDYRRVSRRMAKQSSDRQLNPRSNPPLADEFLSHLRRIYGLRMGRRRSLGTLEGSNVTTARRDPQREHFSRRSSPDSGKLGRVSEPAWQLL